MFYNALSPSSRDCTSKWYRITCNWSWWCPRANARFQGIRSNNGCVYRCGVWKPKTTGIPPEYKGGCVESFLSNGRRLPAARFQRGRRDMPNPHVPSPTLSTMEEKSMQCRVRDFQLEVRNSEETCESTNSWPFHGNHGYSLNEVLATDAAAFSESVLSRDSTINIGDRQQSSQSKMPDCSNERYGIASVESRPYASPLSICTQHLHSPNLLSITIGEPNTCNRLYIK